MFVPLHPTNDARTTLTISPHPAGILPGSLAGVAPVRGAACNDMTSEYLHEALTYDAATGVLTWRVNRPPSHFKSKRGCSFWHTRYAGKVAGNIGVRGYLVLNFDGKNMSAHRIAWIMTYGAIPNGKEIDHINGTKTDNKIANLRLATRSQNQGNILTRSTNTSGYRGVSWSKQRRKWYAQIRSNGRPRHLGFFSDIEDAAAIYRKASIQQYGEFSPFVNFDEHADA